MASRRFSWKLEVILDSVCEVSRDRDHRGVGSRHLCKVQCLHLVLPELVLDKHIGYLGLDVLEGGEGDVSSDLLPCISLLSPCSFSEHLHGDLLRLSVVVLDVHEYVLEWAECRRRSPQSQSQLTQ